MGKVGFRVSELITYLEEFKDKCGNMVMDKLTLKLRGKDDNNVPHGIDSTIKRKKNKSKEEHRFWCVDCKRTTTHRLIYSGHERDSSQDYMICSVCDKFTFSNSDDYLRKDI